MPQDRTSGRTYVSAIERGIKVPTLTKVDALAAEFGVHPLTLLALAYCPTATSDALRLAFEQVAEDVERLQVRQFEDGNLPRGAKSSLAS
ncbi:helix-turn-helix domain-containing protein [Pseudorhodoferax soli]|uniref:helix-turn-helix domain-containing protein n=1 Tax=Pseudorhodoferax soli TaxID=545864 RepID=UPI002482C9B6|nr:helix-turn-helix transcriptional regulator [Pseudorhodoferax soli]